MELTKERIEQIKKNLEEEANEVVQWVRSWINNIDTNSRVARLEAMFIIADESLKAIDRHIVEPIPREAFEKVFRENIDLVSVSIRNKK